MHLKSSANLGEAIPEHLSQREQKYLFISQSHLRNAPRTLPPAHIVNIGSVMIVNTDYILFHKNMF